MSILKLLYCLYKMRLFSPLAVFRLVSASTSCGINIMTLLCFAEKTYGDKIALVDDGESLSYRELFQQSRKISAALVEKYGVKRGSRVGFLCRNHAALVKALFAASLTGADMYLLNVEMSLEQLNGVLDRQELDLLIYDFELNPMILQSHHIGDRLFSYHELLDCVNSLKNFRSDKKLKGASMGKIVLLTGGTTGNFKEAAHKPSMFNYLNPFLTMLTRLRLADYNTAYIATPIYHGYGVAVLLLFMALGKKSVITRSFRADKACSLVREHSAQVMTAVPLMLQRMLRQDAGAMRSLKCIASGGAELSPRLVEETLERLGDVIYNLYGTSEAGLNIVATPRDLRYSSSTVGRKITGGRLRILDSNNRRVRDGEVGRLCIKNSWSMKNKGQAWIETGDMGYRDKEGYYFLCGRVDEMIVSGGENVYPLELEKIIKSHPKVEDAAVIGVRDEDFGQRLKAFVAPRDISLTREELTEWLRHRAARYQMPREVEFLDAMPYTAVGKLDRKRLRG